MQQSPQHSTVNTANPQRGSTASTTASEKPNVIAIYCLRPRKRIIAGTSCKYYRYIMDSQSQTVKVKQISITDRSRLFVLVGPRGAQRPHTYSRSRFGFHVSGFRSGGTYIQTVRRVRARCHPAPPRVRESGAPRVRGVERRERDMDRHRGDILSACPWALGPGWAWGWLGVRTALGRAVSRPLR